ncbi:MAG: hypothetical protein Ct9H90mP9_1670 [Pseudomonadota bacterium]|nr:MAG: hypothetical protein Ct9H90mP9_1670 [Pseudomonadota bacterium]
MTPLVFMNDCLIIIGFEKLDEGFPGEFWFSGKLLFFKIFYFKRK